MKNFKLIILLAIIFSSFNIQAQDKVKPPKPEKPYVVLEKSRQITRLDIRRNTKAKANIVEIETYSIVGGSITLLQGDVPTIEMTGLEVFAGSFGMRKELSRTGRAVITQLSDVVFPLRLRISLTDRPNIVFEVELKEPGTWNMTAGVTL